MQKEDSSPQLSKDDLIEQIYAQRIKNQQKYRDFVKQLAQVDPLVSEYMLKESEHTEQEAQTDLLNFLMREKPVQPVAEDKSAKSKYSLADVLRTILGKKFSIQSANTKKYLACKGDGKYRTVEANNKEVDASSKFTIVPLLSFMAHGNWRYLCAQKECRQSLQANREWNYGWETFWPLPQSDGNQAFPMRTTNWRQPWIGDHYEQYAKGKENNIGYRKKGEFKYEFIDVTSEYPWSEQELATYHNKRICKAIR